MNRLRLVAAALICAAGPGYAQLEQDPSGAGRALSEAREALARQAWSEAELLLERALMLNPSSAETLIELARLLALRGRPEEASAMVEALMADPRTPEPQLRGLRALLAQLDQSRRFAALTSDPRTRHPSAADLPGPSQNRWRFEATTGYSSNPLVVTSASAINVTLPEGTLSFPLEGRPGRAAYGVLTAGMQAPSGIEVVFQAQQVDLPNQEVAYRAGLSLPLSRGLMALLRTQRFGDGTQRYQVDVSSPMGGAWTAQAGWYQEPSRLRQGPRGRVEWMRTVGQAAQLGWWIDGEANWDAGAPGYAGVGARAVFSPHPSWVATTQAQVQKDTAGYSPLLERNARRTLLTYQFGLEAALGSASTSPWRFRLYDSRRISNLALFSWKDRGVQLVWRRAW